MLFHSFISLAQGNQGNLHLRKSLLTPAWSTNLGKRLIKSPKIYLSDLNLLSYMLNINISEIYSSNKTFFGQILENFVAIELKKQLTFSDLHAELFHYRTASGQEVDFILEGPAKQVVGLEVKAKSQVSAQDIKQLENLKDNLGNQFKAGFVIYLGNEIIPFGENIWAVPVTEM
jgi:predicted AAA+ superfamily ATPase